MEELTREYVCVQATILNGQSRSQLIYDDDDDFNQYTIYRWASYRLNNVCFGACGLIYFTSSCVMGPSGDGQRLHLVVVSHLLLF